MPSVLDLISKLRKLKSDFNDLAPLLSKNIADNASAYIEARWVNEGKTASGETKKYSEKQFSAGLMFRNSSSGGSRSENPFNKSTREKLYSKAKKGELVSYKDIRGLQGLETNHKQFRLTGKFWKSIEAVQTSEDGFNFTFTVGSNTSRGESIIERTADSQGIIIIDLSTNERDLLLEELVDRINELFRKYLT